MTEASFSGQATMDAPATSGAALTALDRCDQCGAQAYIRVGVGSSELLFCAHHGHKYQEKLSGIASSWHDESARLSEQNAR